MSKAIKWGLYEQSMPSIFEVCDKADKTLFRSVMNNSEHVLHQYLPPRQTHNYALRARVPDRQLSIATTLQSKCFLTRIFNKDTYWFHTLRILWFVTSCNVFDPVIFFLFLFCFAVVPLIAFVNVCLLIKDYYYYS